MLEFSGSACFRHRLVLSLLSGKAVRISDIRPESVDPGVLDYEVRFLRLLEQLTNGTTVDINLTGTVVTFKPGSIHGGEVDFDCGTERGIVYFLEPLLILAPFAKLAFLVTLRGITSDDCDISIDAIKNVSIKLLGHFGVNDGVDFRIKSRGMSPDGGGEVYFTCPVVTQLKAAILKDAGKIKRIRGVASTTRVSPQLGRRAVEGARGKLNGFIPDVHVYMDSARGENSGKSPGYALYLQAESTSGAFLCADGIGVPHGLPEDLGAIVAKRLLREIKSGGFVGRQHQWMAFIFMALSPGDLCQIAFGELTDAVNGTLVNDIRTFLGVSFRIINTPRSSGAAVLVSCVGSGYVNLNKRIQ